MNTYLPKTIALLELSGNGLVANDIGVRDTLQYYWKNYREFKAFPIVNTNSELSKNLEYLEFYYQKGYRYFLGFCRSSILAGVLNWFNLHPDAVGISTTSTAPILNIPKKVFRVTANDDYILESVLPQLEASSTVFYLYNENELACLNILEILQNNPIIAPKLQTFPVQGDDSNLTVSNVQNFFQTTDSSQSTLVYIFRLEKYIQLYNEGLTFNGQQYDILGIQPPDITGEAAVQLNDKYNITNFKGTNTSIIWRNGYNTLGQNNYSIVTLNCLLLLNVLITQQDIENINSHFGVLEFDPVTRDILYPSFLVETFKNGEFKENYLNVNDPLLGKYQANFLS